jgi:sugar phosphate isomerase/epimerase
MQIGVMNNPALDLFEELEWIAKNGFDFVDLTLEPPAADPSEIDIEKVKDTLCRLKLGIVAHTAYYIPLSSPFKSIRQASLNEFRGALEVSQKLGATLMNVHYVEPPSLIPSENSISWHVEVLKPLCEEAASKNVTIMIENAPRRNQFERLEKILEQVPLLALHLDSGHTQVEGGPRMFKSYLKKFAKRIKHLHFSDNDGRSDQHLPLDSLPRNGVNWPKRIAHLKKSGFNQTITLEVFSINRNYLTLSRDLLRKWWDEA